MHLVAFLTNAPIVYKHSYKLSYHHSRPLVFLCAFSTVLMVGGASAQVDLKVDWSQVGPPTKTVITLQVVQNPPLLRGSAIHDNAWKSLRELGSEKTRLALWYPYPRLAVAELAPPSEHATSWDFSQIDPIVEDFFAATAGAACFLGQRGDTSGPYLPSVAQWKFTVKVRCHKLRNNSVEKMELAFVGRVEVELRSTDSRGGCPHMIPNCPNMVSEELLH
jgi:hypothetical protein